jgi:exodeoxyribonuclease-3
MKIATFNINNINRRLPALLARAADASPDVICLPELKAKDRESPVAAIRRASYGAIGWAKEPGTAQHSSPVAATPS